MGAVPQGHMLIAWCVSVGLQFINLQNLQIKHARGDWYDELLKSLQETPGILAFEKRAVYAINSCFLLPAALAT